MKVNNFFKGVAAGMIVSGAVTGMIGMMGKKSRHPLREKAGRTLKAVGEIVENLGSVMRD